LKAAVSDWRLFFAQFSLRIAFPMRRPKPSQYVGVGIYTIPEAARLVGVGYHKIRRWIGDEHGHASVIDREFPDEKIVTFMELMELHFISLFRREGVSLQTIRRAAVEAARKFRTGHPFAVQRFDTDGKAIFATLTKKETNEQIVEELRKGQLVFDTIIRPFFRKIEYHMDGTRYWPMEMTGRIVLDPARRFGHPIDSETGVPTDAIIDALCANGGQDANEVAKWLDIPLEAVQAAILFEKSLAA
jgi:uncharacterized protein (DUF433 family)